MRPRGSAVLLCCLLLACTATATQRILTYNVTKYFSGGSSSSQPPWMQWVAVDRSDAANRPAAANLDDPQTYPKVAGFSFPFFSMPAASLYVDSNGIAPLIPYNLCPGYFCGSGANAQSPAVKMSASIKGGGGDVPMLGLYAFDLDPSGLAAAEGVFTSVAAGAATVEYYKVPQWTAAGSRNAGATPLIAQLTASADGGIVFRYQQVINKLTTSDTIHPAPTVGIALTKRQRVTAETPFFGSQLAGIRFAPHYDPCAPLDGSCGQCTAHPSCVWCPSISTCVHDSVAEDFCSALEHKANGTGGCTPPDAGAPQAFYAPSVSAPGGDEAALLPSIPEAATVNLTTAGYTQELPLPFDFDYFNFPGIPAERDLDVSKARRVRSVVLVARGLLTFPIGERYKETVASCGSDLCGTSIIAESVIPLLANFKLQGGTTASVLSLPPRPLSTACSTDLSASGCFCWPALAALHNTTHCRAGWVLEVVNFRTGNARQASRPAVQVLLDAGGGIALRMLQMSSQPAGAPAQRPGYWSVANGDTELYVAYPPVAPSLVRVPGGNSTASVPWPLLGRNATVVFQPVRGCLDCQGRGYCDTTTYQCVCDAAFRGPGCSECSAGYWGPQCIACPSCKNGGACDDGMAGHGRCNCPSPWSGEACERSCPSGAAQSCAQCDPRGGYCDCGVCRCNSDAGWRGAACDEWADPCRPISLSGCAVCSAHTSPLCEYCLVDYTCIVQAGVPRVPAANRSLCKGTLVTRGNNDRCSAYVPQRQTTSALSVFLVIAAVVVLGLLACVALMFLCCCRRVTPNPLVYGAVAGYPDYQRPRRERELLLMYKVDGNRHRGLVQGIPLKQLELKDLYEQQQQQHGGASEDTREFDV